MSKNFKIRTLDQDGNNEEIVEIEFTNEEWEILQDFARYAEKLENNSLVQDGIPSSLTVNWQIGEGLKVETKLPSDEQIDAMLMKLRPFILNNERTNFNRVRKIVKRVASSKRVRDHLDTLQYLYSGERQQSLFVAGVYTKEQDPKIINSEDMLQIWLNGDRFHQEKEKQRILDAMHGIMPIESSIVLFLALITDKVIAIMALRRIVELFKGEHETIFVNVILEEPIHYHTFLHASIAQFDLLPRDEEPHSLPQEGVPFAKVFDLTNLGPAAFHQLLDLVGKFWMHGRLVYEMGETVYFFRVSPGFRTEDGTVYEHGADVIATFKVIAFLVEDPLSEVRRKPVQTTLERMQAEKEGRASTQVLLKAIETQDELDGILNRDPKPKVDIEVVPRVAFKFAYWPISKQALENLARIRSEGRTPTFEEVEGSDLFRAWEIFAEEDPEEQNES